MRVNVYAEEMTDRVSIVSKVIEGEEFTGVRFYLELPVTRGQMQISGPFVHKPGDDDSSAVTFWGKKDLARVLLTALQAMNKHRGQISNYARVISSITVRDNADTVDPEIALAMAIQLDALQSLS